MADSNLSLPLAGPASSEAGTSAIPDHELLHRIGRGSYGEVWLARNHAGTLRAVKIIRRAAFDSDRPYEREYAGLQHFEPLSREHPGLVDILHLGRNDAEGWFYSIMELADGAASFAGNPKSEIRNPSGNGANHDPSANWQSYRPLTLEHRVRAEGRLPVKDCVAIAAALAEALRFLHERGLVHRDIKPSNIIFAAGVPKLADVGLVARTDSARSFVGTEGFVPPEGPGTVRADLYSLGKCLYEMAMGKDRQAFPSPPTQLDELPDRAELLELNEVITKACAPQPNDRYQNAAALVADLRILDAGQSLQRSRRRARFWRGSAAAAALGLVCLLGWLGWRGWRSDLELVREFALPGNKPATAAQVGDMNGDGTPDLVVTTDDDWVYCLNRDGTRLGNLRLRGKPDRAECTLLANFGGPGGMDAIISKVEGTNLSLQVLSLSANLCERFQASVTAPLWRGPNGVIRQEHVFYPVAVRPARKDEPAQFLTFFGTGFSNGERVSELRAYNGTNQAPAWRFPIACSAGTGYTIATDLNGDGKPEWLVGTYASGLGKTAPDGTTDANSELHALTTDGQRLWRLETGEVFSGSTPRVFPLHGTNALYCLVFRDAGLAPVTTNTLPPFGRILRLSPAGKELARYEVGTGLTGLQACDTDGSGRPQLLAPDQDGCLQILDADTLRCLRIVPLAPRTNDWVNSWLGEPADLDGDGQPELVMLTTQVKFICGRDVSGYREPNVRHYSGATLHILSAKLDLLASLKLQSGSSERETFRAQICGPSADGTREIVVLGPKVQFYRYHPATARR